MCCGPRLALVLRSRLAVPGFVIGRGDHIYEGAVRRLQAAGVRGPLCGDRRLWRGRCDWPRGGHPSSRCEASHSELGALRRPGSGSRRSTRAVDGYPGAKLGAVPSGTWPDYLLARAMQTAPDGCGVVGGSTPVVSFGDPLRPAVATLGINPSKGEFLAADGSLLSGESRRLATLESLDVTSYDQIGIDVAAAVVDDCASYFRRRPYQWFKPLDEILRAGLAVSYFEDTACHLDLVQWATDPLWSELDDVARARLLSLDRAFLTRQLSREHYLVIVVNGRTALQWVERAGIAKWRHHARLAGPPPADLVVGDNTEGPTFLAWSCNIQSQRGARRHIPDLVDFLAALGKPALAAAVKEDGRQAGGMSIDRGTHARTGDELLRVLGDWLDTSGDETIGDVSRFSRAPWMSVETPLGLMDLNTDTRRSAVAAFVEHARRHGPGIELHVVANQRGRVNKVVYDQTRRPPTGWYAYLRHEAPEPQSFGLA